MRILSEIFEAFKESNSILRHAITIGLAAAFMLLLPLIAMQFTDEVDWSVFDFAAAWILLFGAGFTYKLVARKMNNAAYRTAVGIAVATALLIVWINLAVGFIGSENNPANLMYFGVLIIGVIGAVIARFQPQGMSIALLVTALAHSLAAMIALIADLGYPEDGPMKIMLLNGFFIVLWIVSGMLFKKAAAKQMPDDTTT